MSARDTIVAMLRDRRGVTAKELAEGAGVTRQRVSQVLKELGVTIRKGRRVSHPSRRRGARIRTDTSRRPGSELGSHFVGGASELTAAAALLRRGIPVYRALTFCSACDLIIEMGGKLLRVEVRSARRSRTGHLAYPVPADRVRYDVLALVERDGTVTFKPSLFDEGD